MAAAVIVPWLVLTSGSRRDSAVIEIEINRIWRIAWGRPVVAVAAEKHAAVCCGERRGQRLLQPIALHSAVVSV
jgi:hypothetical protein